MECNAPILEIIGEDLTECLDKFNVVREVKEGNNILDIRLHEENSLGTVRLVSGHGLVNLDIKYYDGPDETLREGLLVLSNAWGTSVLGLSKNGTKESSQWRSVTPRDYHLMGILYNMASCKLLNDEEINAINVLMERVKKIKHVDRNGRK